MIAPTLNTATSNEQKEAISDPASAPIRHHQENTEGAPLDALLALVPDEHKPAASKLIVEITGLRAVRSPNASPSAPPEKTPGAHLPPAPPAPSREHLKAASAERPTEAAPRAKKGFIQ